MPTLLGQYLQADDTTVVHVPYVNKERSFDNHFDFLEVAYEVGVQQVLTRIILREVAEWEPEVVETEDAF